MSSSESKMATGVGVNALIAKCLGQGNRDKANKVAGNAIFLGIIIYAVFLLFGLFGTGAYVRTQTSNREIIEMASGYLKICCIASFGIVFYSLYEKMIQATGRSMYSTIAQVSGAVLNIILDPIMIYGLLGCPELGVRDAITPIVSFNYGMKDKKRIKEGIKYGLIYTLIIMAIGLIVLENFASIFTSFFGLSGETASLCVSAIRIISLSFLFAGTNIAMQGCFQALGDGLASLIISVLRQFLLVVPVAWLFALLVKYVGAPQAVLWITFFIGEGLSAIVSVILIKRVIKNKVDVIN